jgi:catalase
MPSPQVFAATDGAVYNTSNGAPVAHPYAAQRVGPFGPLLLQGWLARPVQTIFADV